MIAVQGPPERNSSSRTLDQLDDDPIPFVEIDLLLVRLVGVHSQLVDAGLKAARPPLVGVTLAGHVEGLFADGSPVGRLENLAGQFLRDPALEVGDQLSQVVRKDEITGGFELLESPL